MNQTMETTVDQGSSLDRYLQGESGYGLLPKIIDMSTIRAFLWRQRILLIVVIALSLLVGLVLTLLAEPTYRATAEVRVDTYSAQIVEGQEVGDPLIREVREYMDTLGQVITSRSMAGRVVDNLDLQDNEELVGEVIAEAPEVRREYAISRLVQGVSADVPTRVRIISINFVAQDPALAARIANGYAEAFIQSNVDQGVEANATARQYLEQRIADLRAQLRDAEVRATDYARNNRIVSTATPASTDENGDSGIGIGLSLTGSNLAQVSGAYAEARSARIQAEQRWRAVSGVPATEIPEAMESSTVQSLRTEQARLQSELATLRQRYQDDYPEIREILARLGPLQEEIQNAANEIKFGIRQDYLIAQRQENALANELERVSDLTLNEQSGQIQYNMLQREAAALRDQLTQLLARYNQLVTAANLRSNNASILDRARTPGAPFAPDPLKNMLVALILGVGLAGALAILREAADDRLRSMEDVERKLGVQALGQTPHTADVISDRDDHFTPFNEAYSSLRATIGFKLSHLDKYVLQVTSSQPSEGKTTTATALAEKYAAVGRKVLLVDFDLRRPAIERAYNLTRGKAGILDVLFSRAAVEQAVVSFPDRNFDVLPVGEVPDNPVEVLSSGLVPEFLARVRQRYDVIILDSSPVLGLADAPLLSRYVDGVVFVVEANRTSASQAKNALRRLHDMNAHIVGAVVTKYKALQAGDSYGYQYAYYSYNSESE